MGAQNALWQSQLAVTTAASSTTTMTNSTTSNNSPTLNGFGPTDLQALQMALQQQQHHLQTQLQSFLLFQQPNNVHQASAAVMLQSQIQQAVAQATNQLRLLQRHKKPAEEEDNLKVNLKVPSPPPPASAIPAMTSMSETKTTNSSSPFSLFPSYNCNKPTVPPPPHHSPQFPPPGVPRLDLPADENVDLEELEQFAKEFKQRRIKLGKELSKPYQVSLF